MPESSSTLRQGEKRPIYGYAQAGGIILTVNGTPQVTVYGPTGAVVTGPANVTGFDGAGTAAVRAWLNLDSTPLLSGVYTALFTFAVTGAPPDSMARSLQYAAAIRVVPTGSGGVYVSPTAGDVENLGVNLYVLGQSETELQALLVGLISDAEDELALRVGQSKWDATDLSDREVSVLQQAVTCGTAYRFLRLPRVQMATGSGQPLLYDGREIAETSDYFHTESWRLADLVASGEAPLQEDVLFQAVVGTPELPTPIFSLTQEW